MNLTSYGKSCVVNALGTSLVSNNMPYVFVVVVGGQLSPQLMHSLNLLIGFKYVSYVLVIVSCPPRHHFVMWLFYDFYCCKYNTLL